LSEFAEDAGGPVDTAPPEDSRLSAEKLEEFFGSSWQQAARFHALLREQGEQRGLIGPREVSRIWTRHILNSAALTRFLPAAGAVADIGTGAGLPGVVVAVVRPDLDVHLIEPMQRRIVWLEEVVVELDLRNVTLHTARAEELHGVLRVDVATARAVAPLGRLAGWSLPLVRPGGRLVALKGRRAAEEIAGAEKTLGRLGVVRTETHEVDPMGLGDPTTVVELTVGASNAKRPRK
jgi:16S rRNA (guanine527-N7)-methyltransferase